LKPNYRVKEKRGLFGWRNPFVLSEEEREDTRD